MDICAFKEHSENQANFTEGGILHCLDAAYLTKESTEPVIDQQVMQDTEVDQWVRSLPCAFQTDPRAPGPTPSWKGPSLRLVALENPEQTYRFASIGKPLGVPKEVYESIVTSFKISPLFLTTALNLDAVYFKVGHAFSHTQVIAQVKQHHQQLGEVDPYVQHIFRTYSTPKGHFCLGLTYRPSAMQTTAFLSGLRHDEIQELFTLIRSYKMHMVAPMLVPTLLTGFALKYIRTRLYQCHQITDKVREEMGLAQNVIDLSFSKPSINDSLQLSQSLTTIFGKVAKYGQHCGSLLDLLHFLDESSQSCLEAAPESGKYMVGEATALIRTLILHMTCSTQSLKDWIEFLRRRAQGYVQTVYSLIAQRDNLLSIQAAEASLRTAEAIRADGLDMKAIAKDSRVIAEDSKVVAVESLRKSDTMHSIAVVTMLFLPATFIATLFSTTFFNFQAKDGPVVSHWIWLYVLVTTVMTIAIQCIWFLNSQKHMNSGKMTSEI